MRVSRAEMGLVQEALQKKHPQLTLKEQRVVNLMKSATGDLELNETTEAAFRSLKIKVLGRSAVVETFEERLGILPKDKNHSSTYQLSSLNFLLKPWRNASSKKIESDFKTLSKVQQKILLKAITHFITTDKPLLLTKKEALILYPLTVRLQKMPKGEKGPERDNFQLFKELYPHLRGIDQTEEEIKSCEQIDQIVAHDNDRLLFVRDVLEKDDLSLSEQEELKKAMEVSLLPSKDEASSWYVKQVVLEETSQGNRFPGPDAVPLLQRRQILGKGESLRKECEVDFRQLRSALETLKFRKNPTPESIHIFQQRLKITKEKMEAYKNLYKPHVRDPLFSYLYGRALLDYDQLLSFCGKVFWNVEAERAATMGHAFRFLERASILGIDDAKILLASLTGSTDHIHELLELEDPDGWKVGAKIAIQDGDVKTALERLKPLGRKGGHELYQLFFEGSKEAETRLIDLIKDRLSSDFVQRNRFENFLTLLLNYFSFGTLRPFAEEEFFSRKPRELSNQEVQFLISASLLGNPHAKGLLKDFVERGFTPKHRLKEAQQFLGALTFLGQSRDPRHEISGMEEMEYFEKIVLGFKFKDSGQYDFFMQNLRAYSANLDPKSEESKFLSKLKAQFIPSRT